MKCVYDLETLINTFTATFKNVDTQEVHQFVIHKLRDDSEALREFLDNCTLLIGFNNLDFDTHLITYFLTEQLPKRPQNRAAAFYREAQELINAQDETGRIRKMLRRYGGHTVPQMDLMKIHHFDNMARFTSLKWLAINMGMDNVMDMPISHDTYIEDLESIDVVLEYNLNDVEVTYELYKRSASKIKLREVMSAKYGVDMTNFPDPKIGETIVLKKLSEKLNMRMQDLRKCRTYRKDLRLSECILPTINFKTDEFKRIQKTFSDMVVVDNFNPPELVCSFDDVPYYFGLGGIHACRANGVYRGISSCDVSGYYPRLAVSQGFFPYHFGQDFVQVYGEIARERALFPKGSDENTALKLAQNGVFGKSNSIYSALYDPKFFYQITINGQLLLAMLCERITIEKAGRVILANTDGLEIEVWDQEKFKWLCKCWEEKFGVVLAHDKYRLLCVADINNYLGFYESGKVKQKGRFKENKELELDGELHKNFSNNVSRKAVINYFLNSTPVEETVNKCENISDFLMGDRAKTGRFVRRDVINGELIEEKLPKHLRYYVGTKGGTVMKVGTKAANSQLQKGYQLTMFNKWTDTWEVDRQYYLRESQKLLDSILCK